jgi:hypothetical protein
MPRSGSILDFIGMKRFNENRPTGNISTGHALRRIEIDPEFYRVTPPLHVTSEIKASLR